jgi:alanyl-tRNA synthetase
VEELPAKAETVVKELESSRKIINSLRQQTARIEFERTLTGVKEINGIAVLGSVIDKVDADTLRGLTDLFRERYPTGVVILGSALDDRPVIICAVSDNLLAKRFHAGEFVKEAAQVVGGSGGGRPNMAQAGGKDASKLERAISQAVKMIQEKAKAI